MLYLHISKLYFHDLLLHSIGEGHGRVGLHDLVAAVVLLVVARGAGVCGGEEAAQNGS